MERKTVYLWQAVTFTLAAMILGVLFANWELIRSCLR